MKAKISTASSLGAGGKHHTPQLPAGILAERKRQLETEGWSAEHDDQHADGSLLAAAICYARRGSGLDLPLKTVRWRPHSPPGDRLRGEVLRQVPISWPWDPEWWKPKTPVRDLERAGALCLAEADRCGRLDRPIDDAMAVLSVVVDELERIS